MISMTNKDQRLLEKILRLSQRGVKNFLADFLIRPGRSSVYSDGFLYSPGSHPVLLVAHMDTVHVRRPSMIYVDRTISPGGDWWCDEGIGGDDRCGIFIILKILRQLDCHVLFTEDEEQGNIGASKFCKSGIRPDVNFIVEFDRRGNNDAVYYRCDNPQFEEFIRSHGFVSQAGSFSDISCIAPHLKIAAVNLSSGYYNQHFCDEYIRLDDVTDIIQRAVPLVSDVSQRYEYIKKEDRSKDLWRETGASCTNMGYDFDLPAWHDSWFDGSEDYYVLEEKY